MTEFGEKERDVLRLLKDYRAFVSNFGGAMPLDETGVVDASYGPAGMVLTGAGFRKGDVPGLARSYRALVTALAILRRESIQEWGALIEPYLSDVADSGVVADWRAKIALLDAENDAIRRHNEEQREAARKGKKAGPLKDPKVRHVFMRTQLERHDRAVKRLARMLRDVDLEPVSPKLMSKSEEEAGEKANREVLAYYRQVKSYGRSQAGAVAACSLKFGISEDEVERILEFADEISPDVCEEEGCERPPERAGKCMKHYMRDYREKKNAGERAG